MKLDRPGSVLQPVPMHMHMSHVHAHVAGEGALHEDGRGHLLLRDEVNELRPACLRRHGQPDATDNEIHLGGPGG